MTQTPLAPTQRGNLPSGSRPESADRADPAAQWSPGFGLSAGDDMLLPALLEINIRQARAGGQDELAQALQSLQRQLQARDPAAPSGDGG